MIQYRYQLKGKLRVRCFDDQHGLDGFYRSVVHNAEYTAHSESDAIAQCVTRLHTEFTEAGWEYDYIIWQESPTLVILEVIKTSDEPEQRQLSLFDGL